MSLAALFRTANISRVLIVDDDLSQTVDLVGLDEQGNGVSISEVLADPDHEYTFALDEELERQGLPHANATDRLRALTNPAVRAIAHDVLRNAFENALQHRADMLVPLNKIKSWLNADGVDVDEWAEVRDLPEVDRYDMLVVDYFLVDNDPRATYELIKQFKRDHANREHPLLVILMSSDIDAIRGHFEGIRDECEISASRFRILAKPVAANPDSDADVKEKWLRALQQLATERPLVAPIEQFVDAWKRSLNVAAKQMIQRLYDLDASAFALLATTADRDSMKIEEYLADVLSRRVSAEAEEHSFPFAEIETLRVALGSAQATVAPTIDQGVEVRHAQRAIRSLMSDVVWHRRPWWDPKGRPPKASSAKQLTAAPVAAEEVPAAAVEPTDQLSIKEPVSAALPGDEVSEAVDASIEEIVAGQDETTATAGKAASTATADLGTEAEGLSGDVGKGGKCAATTPSVDAELQTRTQERLTWMKRYVRFGTILREKTGAQRYFVNLTQACDIQPEKLADVCDVHYLFIQGKKFPVDMVAVGEKLFDSSYYCSDLDSDEFFTLQWRLRQPFTPSMAALLDSLESYEWVGQLRNDAAYGVLAKYVSQASRVAQIRMPKIYRDVVSVYHKQATVWVKQVVDSTLEASSWEINSKECRLQFPVEHARKLLLYTSGVSDAKKPDLVSSLVRGLKVEGKPGTLLFSKGIKDTTAILMRVNANAELDDAGLLEQITSHEKCSKAPEATMLVVTRAMT